MAAVPEPPPHPVNAKMYEDSSAATHDAHSTRKGDCGAAARRPGARSRGLSGHTLAAAPAVAEASGVRRGVGA